MAKFYRHGGAIAAQHRHAKDVKPPSGARELGCASIVPPRGYLKGIELPRDR
ncbi:MAG: hypothetical protein KME47_04965 [Nodosilinea sp. WJT8-NPBG4]|nr:hypothetical protein [Nodosilinea sp. WJT8-NPBG4]